MSNKNDNQQAMIMETTNLDEVRDHLQNALATLKLMPLGRLDRPLRTKSSWGDFHQAAVLSMASHRRLMLQKPSPEEINHMKQWLDALLDLPEGERRIVVARACRIPWRRLEEMDGRSHTTLRKVERLGLGKLCAIIKEKGREKLSPRSLSRSRRVKNPMPRQIQI